MTPSADWKALVVQQARATGAHDLPQHAIEELAAHLEDIYAEAIGRGRTHDVAIAMARDALAESALWTVHRPRTRAPEVRPINEASGGSGTSEGGPNISH